MKTVTKIILAALPALVLLMGCQTPRQQETAAQRQAWEESIGRRVVNIEDRIFDLENGLSLLRREQNAVDRRLAEILSSSGTLGAAQRAEIESLRRELEEARGATEKKISIILDEIARENQRILQTLRSQRGTAAYAQGYEHVVRSGETVSTIAREYKTTVAAIVEANQLTNPNAIRVGQILFIPQ